MDQQNRHIDFNDLSDGRKADSHLKHGSINDKTGSQDYADEFTELLQEPNVKHEKQKSPISDPTAQKKKVRVKELIDGTFLVRENIIKQLPFVLFLTFLGVIYIGNRFHAEYMVRHINELKIEVGNLRAEQITITSELMNISRPSEVAALVESKGLGLKESMEPPKKLRR